MPAWPPILPCARFSFCFRQPYPALGGGWCPGWPQATPKGPQGLDTRRSQRTLSRPEAKTPALANHPAPAGTGHSTPALSPGQSDPAAQHPIQAPGHSSATHGTGRGASSDRRYEHRNATLSGTGSTGMTAQSRSAGQGVEHCAPLRRARAARLARGCCHHRTPSASQLCAPGWQQAMSQPSACGDPRKASPFVVG